MRQLHPAPARMLGILKVAELPEPPPDSGEVAQENLGSLHQEPEIKSPLWHATKAVGGSALAFGAGMGLGYLANKGVERALGHPIPHTYAATIAPALTVLSNLAYNTYKSKEQEQLRRAHEAYKSRSKGPTA